MNANTSTSSLVTQSDNLYFINKEVEQTHKSSSLKKKKGNDNLYTSSGRRKPQAAELISYEDTKKLRSYFLDSNQTYKYRNYMLIVMGINNGRRCGDLLKLTINDVYDIHTKEVRDKFYIIEQKTGKTTRYGVKINSDMKDAIELYLASLPSIDPNEFLFNSRKSKKQNSHILIQQAWKILNEAKQQLNIKTKGGTHILRKRYGNTFFDASGRSPEALVMLMKSFNHNSTEQTLDYLTISQSKIDEIADNMVQYYN